MKPIIFSTEMVKAILEGRKTITRRVVKPQYTVNKEIWTSIKTKGYIYQGDITNCEELIRVCPYGNVGDRLWVRETFNYSGSAQADMRLLYKADEKISLPNNSFYYSGRKWKPSIFMPRWASRITLEITAIRVERLQEISNGDCLQEGIECADMPMINNAIGKFMILWGSLNKKRGYSWESNPFVWVIEFKKINNA